jgi:hypothetical protein
MINFGRHCHFGGLPPSLAIDLQNVVISAAIAFLHPVTTSE